MLTTSDSEKQMVTTENVPPSTISTEGTFRNDCGDPPSTIAVAMRPNPQTRPITVAASNVMPARRTSISIAAPSAIGSRSVRS